jgi:hypothetical protein
MLEGAMADRKGNVGLLRRLPHVAQLHGRLGDVEAVLPSGMVNKASQPMVYNDLPRWL